MLDIPTSSIKYPASSIQHPERFATMIDIDLLPPEYAPKKLVSLNNLAMICLFFLIGMSLVMSSLRLIGSVQHYSGEVELHDQQIERYKIQAEEIKQLGKKVKMLSARLSLVKELLQENATWSDKLFELCQCLPPEGAWLDSLNIERASQRRRRTTTGSTSDNPVLAEISGGVTGVDKVRQFVANLEDSETFDNVVLESVTSHEARTGVGSSISFKVTVEILALGRNS
jgi:Tfp pilus assembly protein PilN